MIFIIFFVVVVVAVVVVVLFIICCCCCCCCRHRRCSFYYLSLLVLIKKLKGKPCFADVVAKYLDADVTEATKREQVEGVGVSLLFDGGV